VSAPTPPRFRINRHRRLAWIGSGLAVALSLLGMALCWTNPAIHLPLRPGLDFTGGTQIQVERACGASCSPLSAAAVQQQISEASVQVLDGGRSLALRLPALSPEQGQAVVQKLNTLVGPLLPQQTSIDTIGPTLGEQLLRGSLISLVVSFAAIAAYISFTYSGVFAVLALLCLAHDVLITCGAFAWLGLLRGVEVDSLFAVALITVAGYSVTDTVVIYDRIREQRRTMPDLPVADQVDLAVDATLTRSLYTSLTTLLPLIGLIFFGGSALSWFAVALTIGIAVGSWSSIGVAPTLLPLLLRR
jgi:preprotein translocase subunit SecF